MSTRDSHSNAILGKPLFERVASCRVLMVGAGGIGCELLKNLVLSGFKNVEVVDLDTIDLSNLNRQFLFQKQHIKKSKAHVAKESALKFNPSVNITSHHSNIKDPHFNVEWFKSFDIVMNALDNLDARRHVNMMCLAADVPLIESGTTGYLGQAYVIKKGQTECFDCSPKPTPTTYPVCTIRSTPSAPIHCIVWAKSYLFSQLFGKSEDEDEEILDKELTEENAKEIEALKQETEELKAIKAATGTDEYARKVFDKVFTTDVTRLLSMEDMWKIRKPPTPLHFDELRDMMDTRAVDGPLQGVGLKDQQVWTIKEDFNVFLDSLQRLSTRLANGKGADPEAEAVLSFDKDDDDALDFVTATSNLRARVFGIQEKSRFMVKSMAGNIIPAIATTNAIVAGVVVMQAFKVLNGRLEDAKRTYLRPGTRAPQLLYLEANSAPNPKCPVCQNTNVGLKIDVHKATLGDLVTKVVCASEEEGGIELGEEVAITEGGRMLYDVEFEDNLTKTLADLGVVDGKMVSVTAEDDEGKEPVVLLIQHCPTTDLNGKLFALTGPIHIRQRPTLPMVEAKAEGAGKRKAPSDGSGDAEVGSSKKRAVGLGAAPERQEIVVGEDEVVILEDGERKELFVILDDD